MPGLLRVFAILSISLTAGSWLGLGRPHVPDDVHGLVDELRAKVGRRVIAEGAPSPPREDFARAPQERDPTVVPSTAARLNPDIDVARAWRIAEGPHTENGRRVVTLTFDDGPTGDTTPAILKLLARYKVKGTFFLIGRYLDDGPRAEGSRDALKRIAAGGHQIGNHTHDHALLTTITHAKVLSQIDDGAASIERYLGHKPTFFRPPFGELDDFGRAAVKERSLDMILWSAEAQDIERADAKSMASELIAQINRKNGGIVLLHDVHGPTVDVLARLLAYMAARRFDPARPDRAGYDVVGLPEYLREVAAQPPPTLSQSLADSPTNLPSRAVAGQ